MHNLYKKNVVASVICNLYVGLVGIAVLPVYIKIVGREGLGLIGFYAMLQAFFLMLDFGLSPALSREIARVRGGAGEIKIVIRIIRLFVVIFFAVGTIGAIIIYCFSDLIVVKWLQIEIKNPENIKSAVQLMGGIIALRWIAGLYKGIVNGFERLVWLSIYNSIVATVRFILPIPILLIVSGDIKEFFALQLIIAILEIFIVYKKSKSLIGIKMKEYPKIIEWGKLKPSFRFAGVLGLTSTLWLFISHVDRLILSNAVTLSEYGIYSLAVTAAGAIFFISTPIGNATLPRLSVLVATNDNETFFKQYRVSTKLVVFAVSTPALILAIFSKEVLYIWTGDMGIVEDASRILTLYALGNLSLAISFLPYSLQYAIGDLRLHVIGNLIYITVFIPVLCWAIFSHGAIGAAWVWFIFHFLYMIVWSRFVHRKCAPNLHNNWFLDDVCKIAIPTLGIVAFCWLITPPIQSRIVATGKLLLISLLGILCSIYYNNDIYLYIKESYLKLSFLKKRTK